MMVVIGLSGPGRPLGRTSASVCSGLWWLKRVRTAIRTGLGRIKEPKGQRDGQAAIIAD